LFNISLGKYKLIEAKETLRELHGRRELITIVTGLDVYEDFAIESLEIERNSDDGERLNITAEFRKINKVTLRTEEMPAEKTAPSAKGKAGKTKANVGKAATGKPTEIQKQRGITGLAKIAGIKGDAKVSP
ncbi:phage baseplate protein, partial [Avibacterium volantium]|uniref:phage baseplate protein n=1 Tax=Avibacterium TaxID=292486 RepID=UPI0039FCA1C6